MEKEVLEGEVHLMDDAAGAQVVLAVDSIDHNYGGEGYGGELFAVGGIIRGKFVGKRVRVTIEELEPTTSEADKGEGP